MHRYHREITVCLFLALLTVAAYAGVVRCGFVNLDDPLYVSQNPIVEKGLTLAGVKYAWTTFDSGNYHPLTWLSLELDGTLYGLNPAGFHATNLAIHVVNSVLLFVVLLRMTGKLWPSAAVAALFAMHPLHVESVAWIAERKDVLSTFFLLLTLLAYERYAATFSVSRYALVFFFMALGLLAKPMLVSLPFLLLLCDSWPLERWEWPQRPGEMPAAPPVATPEITEGVEAVTQSPRYAPRPWRALVLEKLPLVALAMASSVVTLIAQSHAKAYETLTKLPLHARLGHAAYAYAWYLGKTFWPTRLTVHYPHPLEKMSTPMVGTGVLVLAGVSIVVFCSKRSRAPLAVGWLWFLGSLVPVIGLVQVGLQAYADRYVYIPHIGLFIMLAFGGYAVLGRQRTGQVLLAIATSAAILASVGLTRRQVDYWRDAEALWQHNLACVPDYWMAHLALGDVRYDEGRFEEAVEQYAAVVHENPNYADFRYKLGMAFEGLERAREARQSYEAALQLDSRHEAARSRLVALYARQGKLKLDPNDPASQNQYGLALARLGETAEAAWHFQAAVLQNPDFADAHCNLGLALSLLHRDAEAKAHLRRALALAPNFAAAHFNLAAILQNEGDLAGASEHFGEAARLNPNDKEARERLQQIHRQSPK